MILIDKHQLESVLPFQKLIPKLRAAFQADITMPIRHHHNYANPKTGVESTLLLMPAWQTGKYLGVKLVTVSPKNSAFNLPSIQGTYILFDATTGQALAHLDAPTLTNLRTAAASALASDYLSKKDSSVLLMIGTGSLAPYLIRAHAAIRPIEEVYVWGRNPEKAKIIADNFKYASFKVFSLDRIEQAIKKADIISCATLSQHPLVLGNLLQAGQHIDLVGSYKPDMREADDETILKATLFVDSLETAPIESGDLAIPIAEGLINISSIKGDLFGLCNDHCTGRSNSEEITLFKSVGLALEDLAAAELSYEAISK